MSPDPTLPTWPPDVRGFAIGELDVDLRYRRVTSSGKTTELPQRPFDLLCLLIAEPRALHSRAELFRRVWKGAVVEDANLSQSVWLVRNALGDYAKTWLRTVAKGGYVFEPPFDIVVVADAAADEPPDNGAAVAVATQTDAPRARRGFAFALAALVMLAAVVLGAGAWWRSRTTPQPPTRVVLVDADDERGVSSSPDRPWMLALLRAWIDWKLSGEPGVVVVDASDIARDAGAVRLVLLSAVVAPGDAANATLRVHLAGAGPHRDFAAATSAADVAARIDALARDVVAALVEHPVALDGPPLALDAGAARRYVEALALRDARRPAEAAGALEGVVASAPEFGLARVQRAALLGELGQVGAARVEMQRAETWIAQLPPSAAEIVNAQRLSIQHDYAEAAAAYAALAARHPQQPQYAIAQATALVADGRAGDALRALVATDWEREPASLAVDGLLARALARYGTADFERARHDAERADAVAERAGWPHQRARALFLAARAALKLGQASGPDLYERAIEQYDAAGDRLGALRVRMYAQAQQSEPDAERLRTVVDAAREAGNRELEIYALRAEATRHTYRGEFLATRRLLDQAVAVAEASGDPVSTRELRFELLQADYYLADYTAADRELATFERAPTQGLVNLYVGQFAATLALRRGRYDEAAATLAHYRAAAANPAAYDLEYAPVEAMLALRRGDMAAARLAAGRCVADPVAEQALYCEVLVTAVTQLTGASPAALAQTDVLAARIDALRDGTNRWEVEGQFARLRLRSGDAAGAEARLAVLRRKLAVRDLPLIYGEVLLDSAEAALMLGRVDDAAAWLAAGLERVPADDWLARSRAAILDALVRHRRRDPHALDALPALADDARGRGDAQIEFYALNVLSVAGGTELPRRATDILVRAGIRAPMRPELYTTPGDAPAKNAQ